MTPLKLATLGAIAFALGFGVMVAWGYSSQPQAPACAADQGWRYGECKP